MMNMFFDSDEIMEYAGYRNMIIEDKIEECMQAARAGATSITIDADDLTETEMHYIQEEVRRRIEDGEL